MKVEQLYTGCLAQGAYFIESDGEVAIIDPLRETEPYIKKALNAHATIKYVFETHFHADFVSGHLDLAKKTGAHIVYGPNADTSYEKLCATDGQIFKLGKVTIQVLHTPGHTPESTTYLLKDENEKPYAIFTGDTLFIGDVGRPDLAQKRGSLTKEDLAGWLFDSLRNKIMPLPDDVIVYPAHGAGSACGKNMSSEKFDVLGNQKKFNYALRADMTKAEFIKEVTDGLQQPPQYFAKNAAANKNGYDNVENVMKRGARGLSPHAFETVAEATSAVVLDVRDKADFCKGFVPNSIFIGLDGTFAPWVGALIPDLKQPILIIAPKGRNKETVKRLARVGYDNCIGYLQGGFEAWKTAEKEIDTISTINARDFEKFYTENAAIHVLDVRKPSEWNSEHVVNSQNVALDFINEQMSEVKKDTLYYMHCRSGYRSTIAASILKARGYDKLVNVVVSFDDISKSTIPTTAFVCPSTLK
jgi:hydroxyacylglutathione hydrolase